MPAQHAQDDYNGHAISKCEPYAFCTDAGVFDTADSITKTMKTNSE